MASPYQIHARRNPSNSAEVEQILLRYPSISPQELETLTSLLPKLPIVDMALMTADPRLAEPLAAFHQDHGHVFNAPVKTLLVMLTAPFVAIGLLWWLVI